MAVVALDILLSVVPVAFLGLSAVAGEVTLLVANETSLLSPFFIHPNLPCLQSFAR